VLTEVRAELQDRYGEPPESVLHLLAAGEIRLTCERLGIAQIERKRVPVEEKKAVAAKPTSQVRDVGHPSRVPGHPGYRPLAGRFGQAPQTANLQFSTRAVANRPVTNATVALRETAAKRPANTPLAQAGSIQPMRDMLYVTFSEKLHAAPADGSAAFGVTPGLLMKVVARHAKAGAQLTPQGVLRWPLSGAQADVVLKETRELLAMLEPQAG
jgi:transcription-repair coupling factor (superfamily II helicase)